MHDVQCTPCITLSNATILMYSILKLAKIVNILKITAVRLI